MGIWKSEGPLAFYRGLPIALIFSVPALSSYLWAYDTSKTLLSASGILGTEQSALVHAAGAGMAEAVSGIFWTPMEVIKNKQQQPGKNVPTLFLVKEIYSSKGIRGLYRGYFLGLLVFMPQTVGPISTGVIRHSKLTLCARIDDLLCNVRETQV